MLELRKINKKLIALTGVLMAIFIISGCGDSTGSEPATKTNSNQNTKDEKLTRDEEISNEEDKIEKMTEKVSVSQIIDGDTIVVTNKDGEEETIELLLIDTPEESPEDQSAAQYGKQATDFTVSELEDTNVLLERGNPAKDENGHTLGHIWLNSTEGPINFAELLLSSGLAKVVSTDGSNANYLDEFLASEQKAKDKAAEDKDGYVDNIWSVDGYVTEDGFNPSVLK